jgi:hypothetical protein
LQIVTPASSTDNGGTTAPSLMDAGSKAINGISNKARIGFSPRWTASFYGIILRQTTAIRLSSAPCSPKSPA